MAGADLAGIESPRFAGRGVVALAADAEVLRWSGRSVPTYDLARAYAFSDIDGTLPDQPPWQPPA